MMNDVKYRKLLKRIKKLENNMEDTNIEVLKHRKILLVVVDRKEDADKIVIPKKKHKK